MSRQLARTLLALGLLVQCALWLAPPLLADDKETTAGDLEKPGASAAAEKAARDVLAQLDKGDPSWKVRMEVWVKLMKAGPAAVPVLKEALKKESSAVRAFATQALAMLRGPEAIRKAVSAYDLSELDSARLGQVAPDFTLTDLSGKAYRLSQFRGKNAVVLMFFLNDG